IDLGYFCAYSHSHRERKFQPAGSSFQKRKKAEGGGSARTAKAYGLEAREPNRLKPGSRIMSEDWNTYRTRFLVRAKQLTEPLAFTDPLGREHRGHPGDYLVQSSEGLLRIAPREIFEDVYVPLSSPRDVIPLRPLREGEEEPYARLGPAM